MKKSKLALLLGALLSLFVLAGCPSPAGTPENPPEPQPETEYVTVTFDAGTGAVFSNNKQTFTQRVEKGQTVSLPVPSITNEDQAKIFDFSHYTVNDSDTVYVENTPFNADTILKAAYSVKAPTYIALNRNAECTKLEITITHPSDSVKFNINITDQTENDPDEARSISNAEKTTTVTELKPHHTYKIEAYAVYEGKTSSAKERTINMLPFYSVTIDANGYGKIFGADSYTVQIDEGDSFSVEPEYIPTIKEGFTDTYTYSHFINTETNEEITGSFVVNKNTTIQAVYILNAPSDIILTKEDNGSSMDLTINIVHPSDEVKFDITVTDISTENPDSERNFINDIKQRSRIVSGLTYFHTYSVSVKAVRNTDQSSVITKSIKMEQFYTVTYNAGDKGNYNGISTYSEQVSRGSAYTINKTPTIKSSLSTVYKFKHYTVNDTSDIFVDGTTITSNITLNAVYEVIPPTAVTITRVAGDPFAFNISITHPSSTSVKFNIIITNESNTEVPSKNIYQSAKTYYAKNLIFGNTYSVKVNASYGNEESTVVEDEITLDQKASIPVLFLMYMDGDNNLNDPIFLDLNEAEYGLYTAGSYASSKVKIFSLWDGGPRSGTSGGKDYVNEFASTSSRLLELGAEKIPVYDNYTGKIYTAGTELSEYTIDHSSEANWLSSGEVDMADRNTLKNFIEWVTERYDADKLILQFSNHGGGPRSYMPGTATLENGEKIALKDKYGRRSMCWDDSSTDPDVFLKTSDLSWVFDQLGFGSSKKIEMIIEDVCLGGSIEEAYEIKEYANYFLASPNTIPGMGFDYTNLVKVLCENATSSSLSETLGKAVIEQYSKDYAKNDAGWCKIINAEFNTSFTSVNTFLQAYYSMLITSEENGGAGLSENEASEEIYRYCYEKSIKTDVSTLSLIKLATLNNVKLAIDDIAQEILDNATVDSSYTDSNNNSVSRQKLVINQALRPGRPIFYQGSFSWLYDLGFMSDTMAVLAKNDNWTALEAKLKTLNAALKASIVSSWRDGMYFGPTYSTFADANILCSTSNCYYGLTISGETLKIEINGSQGTVVSGDYPDWYEDLKFGKDCKWQDLLQAEPWK